MGNLRAIFIALAFAFAFQQGLIEASFSDECFFNWGTPRGRYTSQESADFRLDKFGGTGIKSKVSYMYGSVTMQIKLLSGNSAGTVTTFYVSSDGEKHDEIDFEFLGNVTGQPYTIHTNIYTQGFGKREMQFKPWFNPSDDYHSYSIFWNPFEVVWLVDNVPIRVFRNYHDPQINFPDAQPMSAYSSLWNADDWATQGGKVKIDWTLAPFVAKLRGYKTNACVCSNASCVGPCRTSNWWANPIYSKLSPSQYGKMKWIQNNNMIYNYCTDTKRFNGQFPKECSLNQY